MQFTLANLAIEGMTTIKPVNAKLAPSNPDWFTVARSHAIIALLTLTSTTLVHAQAPRHGAWGELGLGYGSASFSCDTCSRSQRLGGETVSFYAGGTLSSHLRLGAGFLGWMNGLKAGARLPNIDAVTLSLAYYRHRTPGGLFVMVAGGLSHYELCKGTGNLIDPCSHDTLYASGSGWGLTLGTGWEMPIGRRTAVRPLVSYQHGAVRRLHSPDGAVVATGWNQNLLTLEVRVLVELIP